MYPNRFDYESPKSVEEAIAILDRSGGEAKVMSGGQSLIPMLKLRFAAPAMIVDINNIPGLDYHHVDDEGNLHIGALCRHVDLEESTTLVDTHPTLAAAAGLVSDPIVRTRGTFGGRSAMQTRKAIGRPQCWHKTVISSRRVPMDAATSICVTSSSDRS